MAEHLLVTIGKERFADQVRKTVHLVDDKEQNDFLNDIEHFPHAYVLACVMDRQLKSERAWAIPHRIKEIIGSFDMPALQAVSLDEYKKIFSDNALHRYNEIMADVFYSAAQDIAAKYDGDASRIWSDRPSSAKVVYDFLQFKGVGPKIATMAANILARQFKIPFSDYYSIDISTDVHILRVLRRTGLVSPNAEIDSVVYKARELCPEFPGIIDFSCWEIGRAYCRPNNPNCRECIIKDECKKVF
ncbi:MAG: Endonuclease III [Pelotomaculum sp. PtaB.Bin104]|jgi:endonuclease III|nr:MAG: Endonuclease III [Pelotomaculum sp. PtaB.Bin104]